MINHRYSIIEKLGEGGSGEVFRAKDRFKKNQLLAIKVLHRTAKAGAASDETFRNEVTQLLNLSHPNLVRIFDFGTVRHAREDFLLHRRFFAMEFVQGVHALEWAERSLPLERKESMLEILLMQTLSVLDYVHREGIIHFDVKPQNLVLVGGKESSDLPLVKLMDFGFSRKQDEALNVPIRGTLEYTAPELLQGEAFDHRIDLYSLGATFYHLLEGRCPFEAKDPVELVKRVLKEEVSFSSAPTRSLRPVIQRLMEKNPARRFRSAEEAAHALAENMPSGAEMLASYFGRARKPRFVGRAEELETLDRALRALTTTPDSPQPPAVVITGGEGIGRTALVREAVKLAHHYELQVYELESLPTDVPFQGIASIVPLLASDVRSFSESGSALVDRFSLSLELDRVDVPRVEMWGEKKDVYVELVSRFIVECSAIVPFVIVADNLHRTDQQSVHVLSTILRDAPPHRIFLLAAETEETSRLLPHDKVRRLPLRELRQSDVEEMCVSVLGDGSEVRQTGTALFQLYGGTPFMVVEALNAVLEFVPPEGLQAPGAGKRLLAQLESDLPRDVDEFLMARFRKLTLERQLLLNVLSCIKYPVKPDLLHRILPFHRTRSADHLRFLLLEGFLGTADNDRALFIRLSRLKQAIYARIGNDRIELHTLVATTLENHHTANDFTELQELAYQFSSAAMPSKASLYYERAAEQGVELFALQRAVRLLGRAIEEAERAGEADRVVGLRVQLTAVLYKSGMYKEAVEAGTGLIRHAELDTVQRMTVFKYLGLSFSRLGEGDMAQEYIMRVLEGSTNEVERLELRQELVGLQISAGHFQEAEQEGLKQLEMATALNNTRLQGAVYTDLGIVSFFQDRFDDAVRYFADALHVYELLNEKSQVINAVNNIGNALSAKGDYDEAIRYWERALKASLEFGTLNQQAQIYSNLGIAYYNLRHYGKAKECYQRALEICKKTGSKVNLAAAMANMAEVQFAENEYESALQTWQDAKNIVAVLDNPYMMAEITLHIADVFARLGDVQTMEKNLREAHSVIVEHNLETFVPMYEYLRGICEQKQGHFAAAEQAFKRVGDLHSSDAKKDLLLLAAVRHAECRFQQGDARAAVEELLALRGDPDLARFPMAHAELEYVLGVIASVKPEAVADKAIVCFKRGMDAIMKEPIQETTWKLAYALAHEYYERGQHQRAREYLVKTRLVLQFFLSHFTSQELRDQYLMADRKDTVFATIDSVTKHST